MPLNGDSAVREMQKHKDEIKPDIPEHSGAMLAEFKEQRSGFQVGQESAEGKEGFAKAVRIMPGSRMEQRKERQTGISICEQIQIITEIPPFTGRIPTDITVGLRERAGAVAIKDALPPAITGMMGELPDGYALLPESAIMVLQPSEGAGRAESAIHR